MANEVAVAGCGDIAISDAGALDFHRFGQVVSFAEYCEKAQFLPAKTTKEQAALAIVAGLKMGMDPFAAIQNIAVINGRPSVWGDAVGGLCAGSGLLEDEYEEEVGTGEEYKIVYHIKRKGRTHEIVREFGYKDAVKAGLWGKQGPWTQYPKRMMLNRARAFAYRDAFPDVLKGIRIAEEEQDAPIDITDSVVVSPSPSVAEAAKARPTDPKHELPVKTGAAALLNKAAAKPAPAPAPEPAAQDENPEAIFPKPGRKARTQETPDLQLA